MCPTSRQLQKKTKKIKTNAEKQKTNYNTNLQKYWPTKNAHTQKQKGKDKKFKMLKRNRNGPGRMVTKQ